MDLTLGSGSPPVCEMSSIENQGQEDLRHRQRQLLDQECRAWSPWHLEGLRYSGTLYTHIQPHSSPGPKTQSSWPKVKMWYGDSHPIVVNLPQCKHCQLSHTESSWAPVDNPQLQVDCSQADVEPRTFQECCPMRAIPRTSFPSTDQTWWTVILNSWHSSMF